MEKSDDLKVGICHLYASKNNTIIHVTDATRAETIVKKSGGMPESGGTRTDRHQGRSWVAMNIGRTIGQEVKEKGINKIIVRVRGPGGNRSMMPNNRSASVAVQALVRSGLKIVSIEDVTPTPTDHIRRPGGRKGRRL